MQYLTRDKQAVSALRDARLSRAASHKHSYSHNNYTYIYYLEKYPGIRLYIWASSNFVSGGLQLF